MSNLGQREADAVKGVQTNPFGSTNWTVVFDPRALSIPSAFVVYHIALKGPAPSTLQVFIDTTFYSNVARGDINDWDPNQVLFVRPGQTIYFYWNSGVAPAPHVTMFCREPTASEGG